ncbi:MAG: lytic transglycosylase domain-containing protein [Kiritimatiellia bacterium]|jgi:hypothetical protein
MKRALSKPLVAFALLACSLSADVPDVRPTDGGLQMAASGWRTTDDRPWRAERLVANQTGSDAFELYDGSGIRRLSSAVCRPFRSAPEPMALALPSVWTLDDFGIQPRPCVRWDAFPGVSPEAMNAPADPLDAAFCIPRYRIPAVLLESACERSVVFFESGRSLEAGGQSDPADIVAMIPQLKKVFAREGVPQQWVWMAEVESALNPRAISSAGAAGLFQLMPATARRFGLRTAPLDDRLEPEKSAGAAAQYLKFLRQEFGCWSLALAAYNAGEGRVKEIMKKRKARTFDEVERYLPSETRAYVPKVMALVAMREDRLQGVRGAYWKP